MSASRWGNHCLYVSGHASYASTIGVNVVKIDRLFWKTAMSGERFRVVNVRSTRSSAHFFQVNVCFRGGFGQGRGLGFGGNYG